MKSTKIYRDCALNTKKNRKKELKKIVKSTIIYITVSGKQNIE